MTVLLKQRAAARWCQPGKLAETLGISTFRLKTWRKRLGLATTGLLSSRDVEKVMLHVRAAQGEEVLGPKKAARR